jgi:acyl-CoA hydrolase
VVAIRHSGENCVTASVDRFDFHAPVFVGDLVTLKASLNYVGRSSMEVGIRVEAEDLRTGRRTHTNSCYLTMVALDEEGRPTEVPRLILETDEDRRRHDEASRRAAARRATRPSS